MTKTTLTSALLITLAAHGQTSPAVVDIAGAPIATQILVRSPADTTTDLQVICLFRSSR